MIKKNGKEIKKSKEKGTREELDISDLNQSLMKKYGKSTIITSESESESQFFIPSSSIGLNVLLGGEGIPSGRILELFGPEHGGKTFLSLDYAINCQKMGKNVCFIDFENALNLFWATKLGINEKMLTCVRPDTAEQAFSIIEELTLSGKYGLIIVDSVASLETEAEAKGDIIDTSNKMGGFVAKFMSTALRKLNPIMSRMNTSIIMVNQIRDNLGVMYGPKETTPGGKALRFYSSIRLRVSKVSKFEGQKKYYNSKADAGASNDQIIGQQIHVEVVKNKMAAPVFQKAEFFMRYDTGIDKTNDLMTVASDPLINIVTKSHGKNTYMYKDMEIDLENFKSIDSKLFDAIQKDTMDKIEFNKSNNLVLPVFGSEADDEAQDVSDDAKITEGKE